VNHGEDLGRRVRSARHNWDERTGVQQWMCRHILGITPQAKTEDPDLAAHMPTGAR
jgi:hypothetical protein